MSTGNPLEQLRRRMQSHATPTAFAALAEEHRRAGRFDEAIAVCRDGLARYPAYVSARVTLGRALLDSGDVAGALTELEQAVAQAPDNLAAARALESAHTALGNAPPPPPLAAVPDLPLQADSEDTGLPGSVVVAQALGTGPDGPQEFGLGPDWSIPDEPAASVTDSLALATTAADDTAAGEAMTQALSGHADAPTIYISPQHLQGEEPAGIWPVPESGPVDAHDSLDAARVFSWAIDPPGGQDGAETSGHVEAVIPPPASVWDEPTIEAPVAGHYTASAYSLVTDLTPQEPEQAGLAPADPAPVEFEPFGSGAAEDFSLVGESAEPAVVEPVIAATEAPITAADGAADNDPSPFWTGAFGGEPEAETPTPFSGWGDHSLPQESGADRSPWAAETSSDQAGPWVVPDGPSASWALGDLHEASGADVTPFASTRATADLGAPELVAEHDPALVNEPVAVVGTALDAVEAAAPAAIAVEEQIAPDAVVAPDAEVAWEGSVKSALGEVFARAGHGESLEPPAHPSPAVRTAMADAAVEAALEDAVLRDDGLTPALASLQQMLDSVRARRAALFGDLHS